VSSQCQVKLGFNSVDWSASPETRRDGPPGALCLAPDRVCETTVAQRAPQSTGATGAGPGPSGSEMTDSGRHDNIRKKPPRHCFFTTHRLAVVRHCYSACSRPGGRCCSRDAKLKLASLCPYVTDALG